MTSGVKRGGIVAWAVLFAAVSLAAASPGPSVQAPPPGDGLPSPAALTSLWAAERVSPAFPQLLRHREVESRLKEVAGKAPDLFSLEEIGRSVEGRSINHLRFGRGPFHVLLWSQMHGDEPTATAALFDLFEYVARHRAEAPVRRMLDALTLHVVPMLNPDGAERFQRRNAQGIDVNRDALLLQSPEGRTLKGLRDRLNPRLGFNLHNQGWRTSAGRTGKPASISLLAVAFDQARTETEGRLLAKKTCAVLRGAVEALAPGQVARYDDEFEVRAFGDNVTKWGTPVVLIETGPYQGSGPDQALVGVNFVALVTALDALASGEVAHADAGRYESLPVNDSGLFYLLVSGATIAPGTGVAPFVGDVGIGISRSVVTRPDGTLEPRQSLRVEDLGDLRIFAGLETIDARGLTLAPLAGPDTRRGEVVSLPAGPAAKGAPVVNVGSPADLMLLEPAAEKGRYTVVRVIRADGSTR